MLLPDLWIMRQAGRYLPEYRETRKQAPSFMDFCYSPDLVKKVTLQPIERFSLGAAIIFSDILVIPDALGLKVEFVEDFGPLVQGFDTVSLSSLHFNQDLLSPVYQAIADTRNALARDVPLIGFCGAPWTLASYIIEGSKRTKDFVEARRFLYTDTALYAELSDILVEAVSCHAIAQIEAGCDIIKLFDSWAGLVTESFFDQVVMNPMDKIICNIKSSYPNVPIICFPKGIGELYARYAANIDVDILAIDQYTSRQWIANNVSEDIVLQGNIDPMLLVSGNLDLISKEVEELKKVWGHRKHIVNLGHGILPNTPLDAVEHFIREVRKI